MVCEFCGREIKFRRYSWTCGLTIPVPCECEGAKRRREEEDRREWREERDRVLRKAIANAKIPPRFRLFPEYGDGSSSYYIFGEQGRGKTEMACGMIRNYLNQGIEEVAHNRFFATRSAKFVDVPELLMYMRKTYDVRGSSEADLMESYAGVGLLCLDDLGKGQMTPWAIERIYTLLNLRYKRNKPIIITSQYDGEALVNRLAEKDDRETALAIWSRIEGMCKIGQVKGPDWRKKWKESSDSR